MLTLGTDPAAEVRGNKQWAIAKRQDAATVAYWCARYFKDRIEGRVKHPQIPLARIERDIKPVIGKLPLVEVDANHIEARIRKSTRTI